MKKSYSNMFIIIILSIFLGAKIHNISTAILSIIFLFFLSVLAKDYILLILSALFNILGFCLTQVITISKIIFATGTVFNITNNKIYIERNGFIFSEIYSIKKHKLMKQNFQLSENIKIGDVVDFYALHISYLKKMNEYNGNTGVITKIIRVKSLPIGLTTKIREDIKVFFAQSKNSLFFTNIILGGQNADLDQANKSKITILKETGIYHFMAISGLHMHIIMGFIFYFFRKLLNLSYKINYYLCSKQISLDLIPAVLSIFFGYFYLTLCFKSSSALRAFIMYGTGLILPQKNDRLKIFFLTCIFMLLLNINLVNNYGFLMSCLATYCLLSNGRIFDVNIHLLPFIQTFSIAGILANSIFVQLFRIILPLACLSYLFKSTILLFFANFLVNIIYGICKILLLIFPVIHLEITYFSKLLSFMFFSISFISNRRVFSYFATFLNIIISFFS